jgi:hypothetical protein
MRRLLPAISVATIVLLNIGGLQAQRGSPDAAAPQNEELTEQDVREEAARRACKVAVCAALRNRRPGKDIACNLAKSWPKEQVESVISKAKVPWPWGGVKCSGAVSLKRETLIKAMSEPKYEAVIDRHTVACEVQRQKGKAEIRLELAPKVTFQNGKAVVATLNWGKVDGSGLVKGVIWTAATADNALNVLEATVIEKVNEFVSAKCDEVRDEWRNK